MKAITLLFLLLSLCGCASLRYHVGYKKGAKAYEKAERTGVVKKGYAVGWFRGFSGKAMLDLQRKRGDLKEKYKDFVPK